MADAFRDAWKNSGGVVIVVSHSPALSPQGEQAVPIIQIRGCLLVSIQIELHDRLVLDLQAALMDRVRESGARGVVLDVSGVEIIDSYITRILNDIGRSVRFMGADCYLVGVRPAVAMTLVEMGVELDAVETALNLDLALARLERNE